MQIPSIIIPVKLLLVLIALSLTPDAHSKSGYPRNELPFCPGGGPPGWMNHFDYKRDQNIRRRYPQYQSPYLRPYHHRSIPETSAYYGHGAYQPYSYSQRRPTAYPAVQQLQQTPSARFR